MTGQGMEREFDREAFKAYSVYYNPIKKNDLFKKALILSLQDRYLSLDKQAEYDYLKGIIKLNKLFALNNNQIRINTLPIQQLSRQGSNFIFTFSEPHNVNIGDRVAFTGIQGFVTTVSLNNQTLPIFTVTNFVHDEFSFSISTVYISGAWTPNTGSFIRHEDGSGSALATGTPKMVSDYNHLLSLKAKYLQLLSYKVSDVTNTAPIKIVLDTINNNIVSKDRIKISGVAGNTNANGEFFVRKINRKTFAVYFDKYFMMASSGNGDYQGIAVLQRIWDKVTTRLLPLNKISDEVSLINAPQIEQGNNMLKMDIATDVCDEIKMDYISNAVVFIDVNDNVINLEDIYSLEFIFIVIAKAVNLFAAEISDPEKYQTSAVEIQTQKIKED